MSASTSFSNPDTTQTTWSNALNTINTRNESTTYSLDNALNSRSVNVSVTGPAGSDQLGGVAGILGAAGDAVGGNGLSALTSGNKLLYLAGGLVALLALVWFMRKRG